MVESILAELKDSSTSEDVDRFTKTLRECSWQEVMKVSQSLSRSSLPVARLVAAIALGDLNLKCRDDVKKRATSLAISMATREDDDTVLAELIEAMGLNRQPVAAVEMLKHMKNGSDTVKVALATYLPFVVDDQTPTEVDSALRIEAALIELSNDDSVTVRDWATSSLGTQLVFTSLEDYFLRSNKVMEALNDRLSDIDEDVRGEAILGLARREDPRTPELLLDELAHDQVAESTLEAASLISDPRLCPALQSYKSRTNRESLELEKAISASCAERPFFT
jgi:HEAT repeat protein